MHTSIAHAAAAIAERFEQPQQYQNEPFSETDRIDRQTHRYRDSIEPNIPDCLADNRATMRYTRAFAIDSRPNTRAYLWADRYCSGIGFAKPDDA
jgi:hypothetical protein